MIVDVEGKLLRVQVKTSSLKNGDVNGTTVVSVSGKNITVFEYKNDILNSHDTSRAA